MEPGRWSSCIERHGTPVERLSRAEASTHEEVPPVTLGRGARVHGVLQASAEVRFGSVLGCSERTGADTSCSESRCVEEVHARAVRCSSGPVGGAMPRPVLARCGVKYYLAVEGGQGSFVQLFTPQLTRAFALASRASRA